MLVVAAAAGAEDGSIAGRVHEKGSPDPVMEATAQLIDATGYAESDEGGRFLLPAPAGAQAVIIRAPGFAPLIKAVQVPPGGTVSFDAALERREVKADEVVVRGRREAPEASVSRVTRDEIRRIPGSAGDALRAVQNLPGVAMVNDFLGQMAVRGGGPQDNLYLIDHVPWPVPFHFGGIVSTVNSGLLDEVDLYAAAFGPKWGNAQDAVLDARTRAGARDRLHARADVNMIMSEALLEGPAGPWESSWTLGARRSYLDLLFGRLFAGTVTAFPRFQDAGGSLDARPTAHDRVHAIALATDDTLGLLLTPEDTGNTTFTGSFHYRNTYATGGGSWINTAHPALRSVVTPYAFDYVYDAAFGGLFGIKWRTRAQGVKADLAWKAGETGPAAHTLEFGGAAEREEDTLYAFFNLPGEGRRGGQGPFSTTITGVGVAGAAYLQDRIALGRAWTLAAGARWDTSQFSRVPTVTPRASLEWRVDAVTTARAAASVHSQFPKGWQVHEDFGNPGLTASFADHGVVGLERRLGRGVTGRVEAYAKRYRNQILDTDDARRYANEMTGDARGVELLLRRSGGDRFFGWASYAWSRSRRRDAPGRPRHLYEYDQPHVATLIGSWASSPVTRIGAKLRWNSGPLVTPITGRYQDADGDWHGLAGDPYSVRLDDYVRLDLRAERAFRFARWKVNLYGELINALNRSNPAGLEYSENNAETREVDNLPRIPYFGVEAVF